jgi:ribonuclease HI/uncharacterized phage-like protein YoqJ
VTSSSPTSPATTVYTDGACSGNPGPGGWAWAVVDAGPFASGAEAHTTNQRMEIIAAFDAVRSLGDGLGGGGLEVVSDSTYVVNCFRDRWWEGWIRKGWVNSQRKPVANRDLWEPFVELVRQRGDVTFRWVKGHSGDPMNDLVDRLAVEAATTQKGRSGVGVPQDLGDPDVTGRAPEPVASAAPAIDGHVLVVGGHRAADLGGYDENPTAAAVRSRLADIIAAKRELVADLVVASGMGLGAEMLGAEAALEVGAPLAVVLAYPEPQAVWPAASRRRFEGLVDRATQVLLLQKRAPSSKQQAGAALARRDAWMAREADEAVLVWDRTDDALGRLFRSFEDRLGEDVWVVDPTELTPRGTT